MFQFLCGYCCLPLLNPQRQRSQHHPLLCGVGATSLTPSWTGDDNPDEISGGLDDVDELEGMTEDLVDGDDDGDDDLLYQQDHLWHDHLAAVTDFSTSSGGLLWHELSVSSGTATILQPFSFHIGNGQLVGLLGPSGSGK